MSNPSTNAVTPAQAIPDPARSVSQSTSPPLDPSRLNHQPAPLPPLVSHDAHALTSPLSANANTTAQPMTSPTTSSSAPLRSVTEPTDTSFSAYLDPGAPVEPPSHPTVAETGALSTRSPDRSLGPGAMTGQLPRRESDAKREIIKLSSFGGEGLQTKPPKPLGETIEFATEDKQGEGEASQ